MTVAARLGVQQRVLPAYRAPFFEALAAETERGLSIFAGLPQAEEALGGFAQLQKANHVPARNVYLGKVPDCLFWQRGLTRWLESWQPQVLILEANLRNLSIPVAVRWMHARHRPVIGWGLGAPSPDGPRSLLWQRFVHQFDTLIAYSQRGAQQYAYLGFPEEKIFVARNAVAPRPAQPPVERETVISDSGATVLYVGRLQARKRLDLLMQACARQPKELQPNLWIVGDGPARPDLEVLASQVYPRTVFHGERRGFELERIFAKADLFVLPGTGGLAVQQAMAHALPVIVAQGDGTQDDLVRPGNGWQVQPDDLYSLSEALTQALSDADRLRWMGRASHKIVAEEVNLETMVATFQKAIQSLFPTCMNY